jgi:predicted PurR-regulated permease PerM
MPKRARAPSRRLSLHRWIFPFAGRDSTTQLEVRFTTSFGYGLTSPVSEARRGSAADRLRHMRDSTNARSLVLGTGALVAFALAPVSVGLAGAVVIYEICARPHAWLARRLSPRFAAALLALVVAAFVIAPLAWLGHHLAARLPAVLATITHPRTPPTDGPAAGVIARVQEQIARSLSSSGDWLPGMLLTFGRGMAWTLLNWSIALLGLYYLLTASPASWPQFARALPLSLSGAASLRVRLRDITQGIVAGTLLSAVVQGAAIGLGLWLAGVPDALFWSACAAIATLVPLVGNALVWLPALLLMIGRQHYSGAIAIAICGGGMPPIIDRVVRATVSRRVGSVHPMVTLVGALAGMRLAGIPGIILGPVALAMFLALVDVYRSEYVAADASGNMMAEASAGSPDPGSIDR